MIIDGITWACETCIRGHRSANCQHIERPLQPLGRKGRPVSQCHHCRSLRHSRSLHTRCKCELMARNGASEANGKRCKCRCMEGEACTCAFKKNQTTTGRVSETHSEAIKSAELPQSLGSCHEVLTTTQTPLQYLAGDGSCSRELRSSEAGETSYTGSFNSPDGWDPTPAVESPTVPSTALAVEGTDWESPWEAYPNVEPPFGNLLPADQLSLELSTLMDAFVEKSAIEEFENIDQGRELGNLDPRLP
ncbi:hypothetical protein TWF506_006068 [Arthrobotrys conoides]|uniref:Copper-fist domain-containing protein n=1 Tax=Arthrobotrys conoides TaxID=74498 RepID=A0AAN8NR16_9PEZI